MDRMRLPGWIIIGSTGRNSGKTELACSLVGALARLHPVVGVKVTTIKAGENTCPRGGNGCGACSTLDGDFMLSEEFGKAAGKDTTRMRESGARRVFWLRARQEQLRAAVETLVSRLEPGALVVAESNSLARVVEPDLFLMVKDKDVSPIKPTAAEVLALADRVVRSDGRSFDLGACHLAVIGGVCRIVEASAVILAGGESRRMGRDKGLISVSGRPLIHHIYDQLAGCFDEILISTNEPQKYSFLDAATVPDRLPGQGPLMAIASSVEAARHESVFVIACDIPRIDIGTVQQMLVQATGFDCVIAISPAGYEPLFAIYRKSALPAMRQVLEAGERRIRSIFPKLRVHFFDLGDAAWYRNLNTVDDLAVFLEGRHQGAEAVGSTALGPASATGVCLSN